jgi:hypothetical protein
MQLLAVSLDQMLERLNQLSLMRRMLKQKMELKLQLRLRQQLLNEYDRSHRSVTLRFRSTVSSKTFTSPSLSRTCQLLTGLEGVTLIPQY